MLNAYHICQHLTIVTMLLLKVTSYDVNADDFSATGFVSFIFLIL